MANNYYSRTYAFADKTTARGSEVKAELDGLASGMDAVEIDTNRSIKMPAGSTVELPTASGDRALMVIGFDINGDVEVQAGVGSWRGDWATGAAYKVRDMMIDAGGALGLDNVYICNVAHTSSASLVTDTAKWSLMIDVTAAVTAQNAAAASAAAAAASETATGADATATAADLVQTNADQVACAADAGQTATDAAQVAADLVATNQDSIDTAADRAQTGSDATATAADLVSVQSLYDQFDDRYLGSKSADPTLDNDGDTLIDGALYYNTSVNALRVYDLGTTAWISIGAYAHPNHTGDVTSTGDGDQTITSKAVTLAKMADMATDSLIGRDAGGTGVPQVLDAATVRSMLDLVVGTNVQAYDADIPTQVMSQAEAEAGTSTAKRTVTAQRIKQAIDAQGGVLQVVSTTVSAHGSTTITTADTSTNPSIGLTITPKGNNSSFRIDVRWFGEMVSAYEQVAHIHRDGARINEDNTLSYHGLSMATQTYPVAVNNESTPEILTLATLDKTGSTAGVPITYELKFSAYISSVLWTNRCFLVPASQYETGISEIIITEIGA